MDCEKIGRLIYELRKERDFTQLQLANRIHVSDKAVSKWERGMGCPDISLLPVLCETLGIDMETLLAGEIDANDMTGGNMKKLKFYICPQCGNLLTATEEAAISCCGKKLHALQPQKAEEKLTVEKIDGEYFITSAHEMTKTHYITFVALLTGDSFIMRRQYPEWDLQARIPQLGHGMLLWYCNQHGLFCQLL